MLAGKTDYTVKQGPNPSKILAASARAHTAAAAVAARGSCTVSCAAGRRGALWPASRRMADAAAVAVSAQVRANVRA